MFRWLWVAMMTAMISPAVTRGGEPKDNPNYTVWSKFKPGSYCTVVADVRDGQDNIHIETTRTLVSVSADQVVLKKVTRAKRKGHEDTMAPITETITARTDKDEIKETGSKEIEAMGKTFKCKVWDSTPAKPTKPAAPGAKSAGDEGMKATIYVSGDVPGGIVRLDGVGTNGQSVTFVLTQFEAK